MNKFFMSASFSMSLKFFLLALMKCDEASLSTYFGTMKILTIKVRLDDFRITVKNLPVGWRSMKKANAIFLTHS
jgi:hypothetical protein